jgi:transcriptional regulator with XRE-family HTH domain
MEESVRVTAVQGPIVIRRRLGAALKQLRVDRKLHLDVVARQLEVSPSKISRLETGQVAPKLRDVRDLLEIYDAPSELRSRIMQWATDAKSPGWWQPFSASIFADLDLYISLESEARSVQMYSLEVSGLLQTESYARMLISGYGSHFTPVEVERLIEIRVRRQTVLDQSRENAEPLMLHVVLDEAALHRADDPNVLREQWEALLERLRLPNVELQILPFGAGFTSASSTFAVFEPREAGDRTVVNVESTGQDAYFDTEAEIGKYREIWSDLVRRALTPEESEKYVRLLLAGRGLQH